MCGEAVPRVGIGDGLYDVGGVGLEINGGLDAAAANDGVAFVESRMEENFAIAGEEVNLCVVGTEAADFLTYASKSFCFSAK